MTRFAGLQRARPSTTRASTRTQQASSRRRLAVGSAHDASEQVADRVAEQIVRAATPRAGSFHDRERVSARSEVSTSPRASGMAAPPIVHRVLGAAGRSLDPTARAWLEPQLGHDLSHVRVHTDGEAARSARAIGARAYTLGSDIVFGAGRYAPNDLEGKRLLAHELAHVIQGSAATAPPMIRRAVELRPPGRGEASAFGRRQELVDRLNAISAAVTYRLDADDRTLLYTIDDAGAMDEFDRKMTGFIDAAQVIPLRLITRHGLVNGGGALVPLTVDSFIEGYVDLDDLLGSSDIGFKLLLAHFITERLQVPNYARRIGSAAALAPRFARAHARGRDAEAEVLQDALGDPSVRHHYDELKPDGTTFVRAFRSVDEGYRVFWVVRGHGTRRRVSVTDIRVNVGARTLTLEDFIAERAAARP